MKRLGFFIRFSWFCGSRVEGKTGGCQLSTSSYHSMKEDVKGIFFEVV
jgi:hypothetical protein